MKYLCLVFATLFLANILHAQEPQYTWGKPITNYSKDRVIIKLLKQNEEGFVIHSKQGSITNTTHHLEFFNAGLDRENDILVQIDGGIMGNMNTIQQIENINGQNYLFSRNWNKSNQKHSFYVAKLNDDGSNNGFKLLDEIHATKINNSGFFTITLSEDQSQLLLLSELPAEKKMQEKLRLKCFESTAFNELWTKDVTLKTPSQRAPNNEVRIDNAGHVFLFKTIRKLDAFYSLFTSDQGKDWNKISLDLDDKVVTEFKMQFDKDNAFHLTGLYTNDFSAYKTIVHGRFYVHLNQQLETIANYRKDWSASEVPDFAISNRMTLDNYHLKDVLFREDGKMLVLMEQLKYDDDIIAGTSPIQTRYEWEYGPMVVLCMNPDDGQILWSQGFNKQQENENTFGVDQFGSAVYYLNQDRLYIYWNNTDLSKASIPPAYWKEPDGTKYVKHKAFHDKTAHATFLRIINPDGTLGYDKKFGLPLFNMHEGASFEMSMNSHFYFPYSNGIVIRAELHNGGQRYRWGLIGF